MVESFVCGCVNIQIVFNVEFELHSIVLNSKVNSQISNGFIVSSAVTRSQMNAALSSHCFKQIARILNDSNKSCYEYEFLRRNSVSSFEQPVNIAYFSVNNQNYLNRVTALNIQITRTLNSTNCCLRSIKINGYLPSNLTKQAHLTEQDYSNNQITPVSKNTIIPSEFIDTITQEIIRIPIRLPSTQVIDKSTWDRYLNEQHKNKEVVKDPFTNLPIKDSNVHIDENLKSKIDHFILYSRSLDLNSSKQNKLSTTASNANQQKCECCLNTKTNDKHLYKISCSHCYCKNCLINLNKMCIICKKLFENSQITRIY